MTKTTAAAKKTRAVIEMNTMDAKKIILGAFILFISTAVLGAGETISGIMDVAVPMDSGPLAKAIDLRQYEVDAIYSAGQLFYAIESQSNIGLIDCFLQDNYFISCRAPEKGVSGTSIVTVSAANPQGVTGTDSFNVTVFEPANAAADSIAFSAQRTSITMETGSSVSVPLSIENNTNSPECFTARPVLTNADRHELEVTVAQNEVCVNANETTSFSATLSSGKDTRVASYPVKIEFVSASGRAEVNLNVTVTDRAEPISIERLSDYRVCREPYKQEIMVRLENKSGSTQAIRLSASNELLLPQPEFPETTLRAGEAGKMAIKINTNKTTAPGEYTIKVLAQSAGLFVERNIVFRLEECEENFFDLMVTPEQRPISGGEEKEFTVVLESVSDEDQYVTLGSESDLPNKLDSMQVFLPANGQKKVTLKVRARETDMGGIHEVKVYAWNSNETEEKKAKVEVRDEHRLGLFIENNQFDARPCSATTQQVFEVVLENRGDFDERVRLLLSSVDNSIQAQLSNAEITVRKGRQEKVYVFINPAFDAGLGNYTATLRARYSGREVTEQLRFRVIGAETDARQGVLEIVSYPKEITIIQGEQKTVSMMVKNPTAGRMENIRARIFGTESGAAVFPTGTEGMAAGETTTLKRTITANENARPGTYSATLEVRADGFVTTAPIKVTVAKSGEEIKEGAGNGILAGFTVFLSQNAPIAIGIVLIILIVLGILLSLLNSNKSR